MSARKQFLRTPAELARWVFVALATISPARAHDSPIDHVDRVVQMYVEGGRLHVVYKFRIEERQAMLQLHRMDADRDGKISEAERQSYFAAVTAELAKQLKVEVGGRELKLTSDAAVKLSADLSQSFRWRAPRGELAAGAHAGKLTDDFSRTHPGPYRYSPRMVEKGAVRVEVGEGPKLEQSGGHPAMIVLNFRVLVGAAR
jgi:hypothetical protein